MKLPVLRPRALPSCPGLTGASSTPRLRGSATAVSGVLDRPVKPGDDSWMRCCTSRLTAAPSCCRR